MSAICVVKGEKRFSKAVGIITFTEHNNFVFVEIEFSGMKPNSTHAIHIHEFGDLSGGCETLGGHWNPYRKTHGSREFPESPRHAGDLINNIHTDKYGNFRYRYEDELLRVSGKYSILGKSVVVHESEDDLGRGGNDESLKNGNAGHRIMCGVIGKRGM